MTNIPQYLIDQLPADVALDECEITTVGALRERYDVETASAHDDDPDADAIAVLVPGWTADDGNAEVYYPAIGGGGDAAQAYVDEGEWGVITTTEWIDVTAWRRAYCLVDLDDDDQEVIDLVIDRDTHTVSIEPPEPPCTSADHDWQSPAEIVGGCDDNPGVHGNGGGVVITEVCACCGRYRIMDTWAQRADTGEQGLTSLTYRESDDVSEAWLAEGA